MQTQETGEHVPLSEMLSFKGKTILVTGAAAGIGEAIAYRFAEGDANLMLLDINAIRLNTINNACETTGFHNAYTVNLGNENQVTEFWNGIENLPDILINNAGIYPRLPFDKITPADLNTVLEINMNSTLWMCQQFIRRREKKGGIIINIASIEAMVDVASGNIPYRMSKAGVLGLTQSLAKEYGGAGFRINAVLPGAIKTEGTKTQMMNAIKTLDFRRAKDGILFQLRLPTGKWGKPDDVARVVVFLASPLAKYISGAAVPVDGGFLAS